MYLKYEIWCIPSCSRIYNPQWQPAPTTSCFHVSQLKSAVGRNQVLVPNFPTDESSIQVPVQILQRRMVARGGELISQIKVGWSGMSPKLATWEDVDALRARFLEVVAWGQATVQARGNVSTSKEAPEMESREKTTMTTEKEEEQREARERRPNKKYVGP